MQFIWYFFLKILGFLSILYILACLYLYFTQESLLFSPRPISDMTRETVEKYRQNIENISITTDDGILLKGWLVNNNLDTKNIVFFFGGNNQEVSSMIRESSTWKDWTMVLINYRGYGESQGIPSEKNFYNDAKKIYDTLQPKGKVVLMGRSIGTGVATYLATKRKADGIILITPYDSITSVAQEKYPFLPMGLIVKHPFDSISRAPGIKIPMVSLVAENDEMIPTGHAKALLDKWGGTKTEIIIKGADHNSIVKYDVYKTEVMRFLSEIQ